jgi:SAM-dependent methyltransferase
MSVDSDWEQWGRDDPYFGVITDPRFRRNALDDSARTLFFESGRVHILHVIQTLRARIDPTFTPRRLLDFGCGVGRVLLPARAFVQEAVGIDVSRSMLDEAAANAQRMGIDGVTLLHQGDLSSVEGRSFDLVHSAIVLQHLEPDRGLTLLGGLIDCVADGGCGALQITYSKTAYADQQGLPPPPPAPDPQPPWRLLLRRGDPTLRPEASASAATEPAMLMTPYPLTAVYWHLQTRGVTEVFSEFTDHGGELGVFLFFQRRPGVATQSG